MCKKTWAVFVAANRKSYLKRSGEKWFIDERKMYWLHFAVIWIWNIIIKYWISYFAHRTFMLSYLLKSAIFKSMYSLQGHLHLLKIALFNWIVLLLLLTAYRKLIIFFFFFFFLSFWVFKDVKSISEDQGSWPEWVPKNLCQIPQCNFCWKMGLILLHKWVSLIFSAVHILVPIFKSPGWEEQGGQRVLLKDSTQWTCIRVWTLNLWSRVEFSNHCTMVPDQGSIL